MKGVLSVTLVALLAVSLLGSGGCSTKAKRLSGRAEDLWGDVVDLSDYASGLTVMHPFSPSDCGYCLFDEEFLYANYGVNTIQRGGSYVDMSLFATQLDVYTYQKHFRESFTVITSPPDLYRYHRDGYPWISVFRDGESIFAGWPQPYEEQFVKLRSVFWGEGIPLTLTSNKQMATRFVYENKAGLGIRAIPDGRALPEKPTVDAYTTKRESDLTEEDLRKNLLVEGRSNELKLEFLKGQTMPVEVGSGKIVIGDYEFPMDDVGLTACLPNPRNPERYLVLNLVGSKLRWTTFENWTDFTVYRDGPNGGPEVLLNGLFERDGSDWKFSEKKAWASPETMSFCRGGKCPSPFVDIASEERESYVPRPPESEALEGGEVWTLGGSACRFPYVCADGRGGCIVVWEEKGDIIMARLGGEAEPQVAAVEDGVADSFNPVVAVAGEDIWVFYLSDSDGFYRLYGSYGRTGGALNEVRISGGGAADCVTPAVVADGTGGLAVAWSEWRANQRFLQYRRISGRLLGDIQYVEIKSSDIDYTNAWYPSLASDGAGGVWGVWNQHYPITLGVYAGNLTEEASAVSEEKGAYPSMVIDRDGRRWVFWESYMRDVVSDKPHRVLAAYGLEGGKWTLPDDLSTPSGCKYNREPEGVLDSEGVIWVAWSGRKDDTSPWGVYLSRMTDDGWSKAELASRVRENARAPSVCADPGGGLWLAWHSGTGSGMKVKVLRYMPPGGE